MLHRRNRAVGYVWRMTKTGRPAESARSVTGVASGGLGTAANLEDTQLWDLDDLRPSDMPEPEPQPSRTLVPSPTLLPVSPPLAPALTPMQRVQPIAEGPSMPAAPRGQRRTGLIAAGAVGILVLAGALALRDGLPGGAITGPSNAAGAFPSTAPIATGAPAKTAVPKPASGGGGGNGHGSAGGNGNGHGGGKNK